MMYTTSDQFQLRIFSYLIGKKNSTIGDMINSYNAWFFLSSSMNFLIFEFAT